MKPENQSDEWLMGQVAQGRRDCLELLVHRFAGPIHTYARRFLGDEHVADEVFQEVFLAVWAKRRQYKFPKTFRSWLFAITANKCREVYRKRCRRGQQVEMHESHEQAAGQAEPMNEAIRMEHASKVKQALDGLTDQQRAVVVMRVWNGFSYAEIADAVGAKEGTVRASMHRALARLKPALQGLYEA